MGLSADYNEKLAHDYEKIRNKIEQGMLPLIARIPAIDKAVSDYVLAQDEEFERKRSRGGFIPIQLRDGEALHNMSDLVLYEELKWCHADKMTIVEYPIMSEDQESLRSTKYTPHSDLQYGDRRYTGRRKTHFTDDYGAPQVRNSHIVNPYDPAIEAIGDCIDLYDALDNAGLSDRQREAINLIYFEDKTQSVAAVVMGVSQPAVAKFERIALEKLREYMNKY